MKENAGTAFSIISTVSPEGTALSVGDMGSLPEVIAQSVDATGSLTKSIALSVGIIE